MCGQLFFDLAPDYEGVYEPGDEVTLFTPAGELTVHFSFVSGKSAIMSNGMVLNCQNQTPLTPTGNKITPAITPDAQAVYDQFKTQRTPQNFDALNQM